MNKQYKEGDIVSFNAGETCKGVGRVRGLSSNNIIDFWIIEVRESNIDPVAYPYSHITMPSSCISEYQITERVVVADDDETNERIPATELYFCVLPSETYGEPAGFQIITLCPIAYWHEHKCMPDYNFIGNVEHLKPEGYGWMLSECCELDTDKTREDVRAELTALGMTENLMMQKFLTECNE